MILKPDKGNSVVVMDRSVYDRSILTLSIPLNLENLKQIQLYHQKVNYKGF